MQYPEKAFYKRDERNIANGMHPILIGCGEVGADEDSAERATPKLLLQPVQIFPQQ